MKYPTTLPGAILGPEHFEPVAAGALSGRELLRKVEPLWRHAERRGWTEGWETAKKSLETKQTGPLWRQASEWGTKLNWKDHDDSEKLAGWLVLKNHERARRMWRAFRRPYRGFENSVNDAAACRRALWLSLIFEKDLPENEKEAERHLLGLLIVLRAPKDLEPLGREAIGSPSIGAKGKQRWMAVSHGIEKDGHWIRAEMETVRGLQAKLEKNLEENIAREIETWKKRIRR